MCDEDEEFVKRSTLVFPDTQEKLRQFCLNVKNLSLRLWNYDSLLKKWNLLVPHT